MSSSAWAPGTHRCTYLHVGRTLIKQVKRINLNFFNKKKDKNIENRNSVSVSGQSSVLAGLLSSGQVPFLNATSWKLS